MPNPEQTPPNPDNTGTAASQTSEGGTGGQAATASAAPAEPDYKVKFAESSREAQRLQHQLVLSAQENARLNQILANTQSQQRAAEQQPRGFDYSDLTDGIIDRDPNKVSLWEDHVVKKAEENIMARQQAMMARNSRIASSIQACQEIIREPQGTLAQETINRYQQIIFDPSYSFMEEDVVDVPGPAGPVKVNPHKLRQALLETKANLGSRYAATQDQINQAGDSIEPVNRPGGQGTTDKVNLDKVLTDKDKAVIEDLRKREPGYDAERYWKYLPAKAKEARLSALRR